MAFFPNKKQLLLQVFATKIGWLFISIFFMILFGILWNWFDWAIYGTLISSIYPIGLALIQIVYAWIINPISNIKNQKNIIFPEKYTIEKGKHRSGIFFKPTFNLSKEREFHFIFTNSCIYHSDDLDLANQINKLCGFSFGYHHLDSIRIGWQANSEDKNKIKLFYYLYNKGVHTEKYICDVDLHSLNEIKILCDYRNNRFCIHVSKRDGVTIKMDLVKFIFPTIKIGYYLFPYFGGKLPAPHDMEIYLSKKIASEIQ